MKAFTMWEQDEGVSRPLEHSIAPGGSLRLTLQELRRANVSAVPVSKCWECPIKGRTQHIRDIVHVKFAIVSFVSLQY